MDNGIDPNAGAATDPNLGVPDSGIQGDNGAGQSGTPVGQGGQANPDSRDAEIANLRRNNQALNKALIDARRGQSRQTPQQQGQEDNPFASPEGQYAISLELATGQLSRNLEDIYNLYPEIPATEIARIRRNPWAFASYESFRSGDVQTAMLEIEQAMLDRATELGGQNQGQQNGNGVPTQTQTPASINPNPAAEQVADADPGSNEDENLWTMPMGKLEKLKNKQVAQQSQR